MSNSSAKITLGASAALLSVVLITACGRTTHASDDQPSQQQSSISVGVARVERQTVQRQLTVSSELVPFQEIDVYAKESGYVSRLLVDYGSHVKAGQLLAVLEIPELAATIEQDRSALKSMQDQVSNANNQLSRIQAQHNVLHLEYQRFSAVAASKPGLVAQQEVDDVQGRDLASEAQVAAAQSNLDAAKSNVAESQAKLSRDQAIYAYARITAPFNAVVTQRYANLGTLVQAGTNSNTNVLPIVRLSEESLYRLVIPVPETYVGFIRAGDPVQVRVPAFNKTFPGKVARFSSEVHDSTRTMHTEVDVSNPTGELIPGLYAEATLNLNRNPEALTVPIQAVDRQADQAFVDVVGPANRVQVRKIELGIPGEAENEVEVLSGLHDGEQVIVSDRSGLKPGEVVHPQPAPPAQYEPRS